MFYVYILLCSDDKTYIGGTEDLKDRLGRHKKGYIVSTKKRLPVSLKAYFAFDDKHVAFQFEQYLKSGSGRGFMKKHEFIS